MATFTEQCAELQYAELLALTALVNATKYQRESGNVSRRSPWPELDALYEMLRERGVLED